MKRWVLPLSVALVIATAGVARGGGYDTPMLYSARHMGMGGTAVAYVNDPSALFHNPAGLAGIKKLSLMGDFSLLVGGIQASPDLAAKSIESEPVIAPFFLLGGGYRINDWLTLGMAVYPVASASAKYKYESTGSQVENSTTLIFVEGTLGAAINIDAARLRIGAGYRVTFVSLSRATSFDGVDTLAFDMKGFNFLGFRVGAQWDAIPNHLSFGINYRHKTVTEVTQDEIVVPIPPNKAFDGSAEFTLPSRLVFGVRGDYANFGLAFDFEYAFNSQNESTDIKGRLEGFPPGSDEVKLANVFNWDNAITLRVGLEYRYALPALADDKGKAQRHAVLPRIGFIYDAPTSVKAYPTAFGTPPSATYVGTIGAGYERGPYRMSLAYAYRFGKTSISPSDLGNGCNFCAVEGDYKIWLNGFYLDFSYDFE